MTALMQCRWVLGLSSLALCCAGPAFAQAPPLPFAFTFDENAHGSVTLPNGTVAPLVSSTTLVDPVVGVPTLFYFLPVIVPRDGFVGLAGSAEQDFGLSDLLHFTSEGVFFFSNPAEPEGPADLADVSLLSFLLAMRQTIAVFVPEVGSEGANGAFYAPGGFFDPGFPIMPTNVSASYTIISDAGPGSTVPAPSSLILLAIGVGLAGLAGVTRKRHRRE
jgi:hypothetical protein